MQDLVMVSDECEFSAEWFLGKKIPYGVLKNGFSYLSVCVGVCERERERERERKREKWDSLISRETQYKYFNMKFSLLYWKISYFTCENSIYNIVKNMNA